MSKTNLMKIMSAAFIVIAAVALGAMFIWAPVCDSLVEMASGNMAHMRCFYTQQAAMYLAIILLVTGIINLVIKNNKLSIIAIIIGIMFITVTTEALGIGVCKKDTMACIQTALWLKGCGVVAIIAGLVQLFTKPE